MNKLETLLAKLRQLQESTLPKRLLDEQLEMGLEPFTALTDAILAGATMLWAGQLLARANGRRPVMFWAWGFIAAAVSALGGVAFHGARTHMGFWGNVISWKIAAAGAGVAALCLGYAAAMAWLSPAARRVANAILLIKFAAFFAWGIASNDFLVAAIDYGTVLIFILALAIMRRELRSARFIIAGVVVSFIAVGIQRMTGLTLGSLDHNDVFHLAQIPGMYLLYRGGVLLEERPATVTAVQPATAAAFS
jgi:hypothetical protein